MYDVHDPKFSCFSTNKPITLGASPDAGAPLALFDAHVRQGFEYRQYAVTRDGSRFLLNRTVGEEGTRPMTYVQNWASSIAGKKTPEVECDVGQGGWSACAQHEKRYRGRTRRTIRQAKRKRPASASRTQYSALTTPTETAAAALFASSPARMRMRASTAPARCTPSP
jgi:hypothetical protein